MLKFRFNKVVSGEVVRDTKRVESVSSNISIKVRRIWKEWNSLGLLSKAGGPTAYYYLSSHEFGEYLCLYANRIRRSNKSMSNSPLVAGAKAEAEPARAAITASFIMVVSSSTTLRGERG